MDPASQTKPRTFSPVFLKTQALARTKATVFPLFLGARLLGGLLRLAARLSTSALRNPTRSASATEGQDEGATSFADKVTLNNPCGTLNG